MSHERGFTLVETLVAITILLLVIIGPMTIAAKGMQQAYYANEQATAVFLAQEAIETVRKLRDDNALEVIKANNTGDTWEWIDDSDLGSCTRNVNDSPENFHGCGMYQSGANLVFAQCYAPGSANDPCKIKMNADGDLVYGQTGADTLFTRSIKIVKHPDAAEVKVTVSWSARLFNSTTRTVELQSWIYDQYKP